MAATERVGVLIVDDHEIMRDGLREILEGSGDFEVVGHAKDGEEAVSAAGNLRPDVVIMDVFMPVKDGIDACREIVEARPETRVLVLTAATEADTVIDAVAAGATGYLQKYSGRDRLLETVKRVAEGEYCIPGDITNRVFAGIRAKARRTDRKDLRKLTVREQEILTLFAQGKSYAAIADLRGNRPLTVRNTVYRIQSKLGIKSKQEMVLWAVRNGLLDNIVVTERA